MKADNVFGWENGLEAGDGSEPRPFCVEKQRTVVTAEQRVPYCTITLFQTCWPGGGNSNTGKRKCQQVTPSLVGEGKGRVIRE